MFVIKALSIIISVFFLYNCSALRNGELEIGPGFHVTNIQIGLQNYRPIPMHLSFSKDLQFLLSDASTQYSSMALKVFNGYYDYVTIGKTHTWRTNYILENNTNSVSLAWFASLHYGATLLGSRGIPGLVSKVLLGKGTEILNSTAHTLYAVMDVEYDMQIYKNRKVQIVQESRFLYLPADVSIPDRTANSCVVFPVLNRGQICSNSVVNGSYTLQQGVGDTFVLGWDILMLAITSDHYINYRLYAGWDESIIYTNSVVAALIALSIIMIAWNIGMNAHENDSATSKRQWYDSTSLLFSVGCAVLCTGIILWQIAAYNLLRRAEFVTDLPFKAYGTVCVVAIACLFFLFVTSSWIFEIDRLLRQACVNTLLTSAYISILIGRSTVCEETVILLIISFIWITQLLLILFEARKRLGLFLSVLCIFACFYGMINILIIVPFVLHTPNFQHYSWVVAQLLIIVPITLQAGRFSSPVEQDKN